MFPVPSFWFLVMATITNVEEFDAFKNARQLVREGYALTNQPQFRRDFALVSQVRRAAVSVLSNIAEGFERDGRQEFIQFLSQAKGSIGEVRAQLLVALDQNFISPQRADEIRNLAAQTGKLIAGLMNYLRHSDHRGLKFQPETRNQKPETSKAALLPRRGGV
jgi:four helix bundle protein